MNFNNADGENPLCTLYRAEGLYSYSWGTCIIAYKKDGDNSHRCFMGGNGPPT